MPVVLNLPILVGVGTDANLVAGLANNGEIGFSTDTNKLIVYYGGSVYKFPSISGTPYVVGGTDVALADGGTGASLSDPGANKLWGWDDTDNAIGFWTIGAGLSYDHSTHTLSASGTGDVVGPGSATDEALARYDGTTGKLLQDSTVTVTDAGITTITMTNAVTNNVQNVLVLDRQCSSTIAAGFGSILLYRLQDSTTPSQDAARVRTTWQTGTHGSTKARQIHSIFDTAEREVLRFEASGSAPMIGFLGASASAQLVSPDLATLATTFGLASGSPTLAESKLTITDITTNDVSTSAHGFAPKISGSDGYVLTKSGTAAVWAAAGARAEGTLAAAGTTQGTAAAIVTDAVVVSGADGTKGVILPNTAAALVAVQNNSASSLKVYPNSGAAISGNGTNNAASLFGNSSALYARLSSTQWYTISMI